jgi:hypothetical protein
MCFATESITLWFAGLPAVQICFTEGAVLKVIPWVLFQFQESGVKTSPTDFLFSQSKQVRYCLFTEVY